MRKDRIEACIRRLAALPPREFDMNRWGINIFTAEHNCGTPACIGGWEAHWNAESYVALRNTWVVGVNWVVGVKSFIAKFWEIDWDLADRITHPALRRDFNEAAFSPYNFATPAHAVTLLRHFLQTGEVNWQGAMQNPAPQEDMARIAAGGAL